MKAKLHSAFTLVEVMISVALALVLILGINEVFGLTSRTVGAGQALSSAYQSDRAAQLVMSEDFKNEAGNAPLIITSAYLYAFRSRPDQEANLDPTKPYLFEPIGQNYTVPANVLHPRNHRMDTLAMCVRDLFQRQTGGAPGFYITPGSSYEAYVWYGHLNLPNNAATPAWSNSTLPGSPVPTSVTGTSTFTAGNPAGGTVGTPAANPNNYYADQWILGRVAMLFQANPTGGYARSLFRANAPPGNADFATVSQPPYAYTVQQSRFDVVQGTIDSFTSSITPTAAAWYAGNNLTGPAVNSLNYRFQCDPTPPRGATSAQATGVDYAAFSVPAFLSGCSQFCVEFAGDFTAQDPTTGAVTAGQDGVVDFTIINNKRQIRWYGMRRKVANDNAALSANDGDVVRVQDVIPAAQSGFTFERTAPAGTYIAAWHPTETNNPRPKLIRITFSVEDTNNRLGNPVTFQYVFPVQ